MVKGYKNENALYESGLGVNIILNLRITYNLCLQK